MVRFTLQERRQQVQLTKKEDMAVGKKKEEMGQGGRGRIEEEVEGKDEE